MVFFVKYQEVSKYCENEASINLVNGHLSSFYLTVFCATSTGNVIYSSYVTRGVRYILRQAISGKMKLKIGTNPVLVDWYNFFQVPV